MNILFITYGKFESNSMGHISSFANQLCRLGHQCVVAAPVETVDPTFQSPDILFWARTYDQIRENPNLFPNGKSAEVIHAWTPRENVRQLTFDYLASTILQPKLIIHLEDNERFLAERFAKEKFETLQSRSQADLLQLLPDSLSHPRRHQLFLQMADGVTGIVKELQDYVDPSIPFHVLQPGVDFEKFQRNSPSQELRAKYGIEENEKVICYPGNSHFANQSDLRNLYLGIKYLNERGQPCRLLRTGHGAEEFLEEFLPAARSFVLNLGFVPYEKIPEILQLADVLVQPGSCDEFNRYRLPSKLPEFFAAGRPVILPSCNLGKEIENGVDGLLLESGSPEEIADKCQQLFNDCRLAKALAKNGPTIAKRFFSLTDNTESLERFYNDLASSCIQNTPLKSLSVAAYRKRPLAAGLLTLAEIKRRQIHPVLQRLDLQTLLNNIIYEAQWDQNLRDDKQIPTNSHKARELQVFTIPNDASADATYQKFYSLLKSSTAIEIRSKELMECRAELLSKENELQEVKELYTTEKGRVRSMRGAFTWRITLPLRVFYRFIRSMFEAIPRTHQS